MTRQTIDRTRRACATTSAALLGGLSSVGVALAQTPPAPAAAADGSSRGAWLVLLVVGVLIAVAAAGGIMLSARRRRMDAALLLQSRVSDALLRDATVGRYPIVATADVPMSPWADPVITLKGTVDRPAVREAARTLVQHEIEGAGAHVALVDRLFVDSRPLVRAA